MSYVSHHVAEMMRPVCIPTDLGIIIQADSKKKPYGLATQSNPNIDDYCEVRAY